VDPPADGAQELLAVLVDRTEVLPDLLDGTALYGGSPDNLWRPSDMAGDIPERDAVLADDDSGLFRFD